MNPSRSTVGIAGPLPGAVPLQSGAFALTPEEAATSRLRLVQCRKARMHSARLHALVVEDQAFHRNLLYDVLHHTHSVTTCSTAADGWKAYLEEAPDIAFLNIGLPDTDGHTLAQRIKGLDPVAYVIMVTASQDVYDVEVAKRNRVDGFIIKPFNKQKIDDCIHRYMATHKAKKTMRARH